VPVDPLSALFAELGRLSVLHRLERELARRGYRLVAGVDEVGRGCLAGPVAAAAVILPEDCVLPGLDDSKRLDAPSRAAFAKLRSVRDMRELRAQGWLDYAMPPAELTIDTGAMSPELAAERIRSALGL